MAASDMMRVLVTGGSGFLGGHVAERLSTDGYDVSVLARKTSNLSGIAHVDFDLVYGDITSPESLESVLRGVDIVCHCAGAVRHVVPYKELYEVNVRGTVNLARAAIRNGVRKIVYASSLGVMGLKGENSSGERPGKISDRYCRSKAEAETALFSVCSQTDMDVIAMRPGVIYGPRDFTAAYHWFKMVDEGNPVMIGDGTTTFPLIYIDDLTEAFMIAVERDLGSGAFDLSGEDKATLRKVLDLVAREMDVEVEPRMINYHLALLIAYLMEVKCALTGYIQPPSISTFVVRLFGRDHQMDRSGMRETLGLRATTTLEEGIGRTAEWYRSLDKGV